MPRSASTVIRPQIAGPPRSFQPSPQVPSFLSPGCGTARKRHTSLPVLTSNACGSPGGPKNAFSPSRAAEDRQVLVDRPAATKSRSRCRRIRRHRRRARQRPPGHRPERHRAGAAGHAAAARPASASLPPPPAVGIDAGWPGCTSATPLVPKLSIGLPRRRIERPQLVAGAVEQPRPRFVVAGPVGHRAHRAAAHRRLEAPQLLAGLGLERDDAAVLQRDVHRRADDDRRVLPLAARHLGVELPRLGQPGTFSGVICVSVEKRV